MVDTMPNPDISRSAGKLSVADLKNEFDTKLSLEKPEYGAPSRYGVQLYTEIYVADDRPLTKAEEYKEDLDKLVRQWVKEDMAYWFPPDTRFSDDSHESPAAKMDHSLLSMGLDYSDDAVDPVVIARVDKRTMDEARRNKEEPDELFFRQSENMRVESQNYAHAALSHLREKGHNLELVKACLYEFEDFAGTLRVHFNFKARKANNPRARVETYFTQLLDYGNSEYKFECCISLGKSSSLPYERAKRGCRICRKYVHHPKRGCKDGIW